MQLDPKQRTNTIKVMECLEWRLRQVAPGVPYGSSQYITGPIVVDTDGDKRLVKEDKDQLFRERGAKVSMKLGDTRLQRANTPGNRGTLGGVRRKHQVIEFTCVQQLLADQEAAGVRVFQISEWLRADIEWGVIYGDSYLIEAANALIAKDPSWGQRPSYINPIVTAVLAGPKLEYPYTIQVIRLEYQWDDQLPAGGIRNGL